MSQPVQPDPTARKYYCAHKSLLTTVPYGPLPNLVSYLTMPRRVELCAEIMDTELLSYADLDRLPQGFDPETCEIL